MNKSNEDFLSDEYCRIFLKVKNKRIGEANLALLNSNELFINDIRVEGDGQQNKGYGTELLKAVKKIAEISKSNRIIGDLSETDIDHMDKLKYFYSKQGFTVSYYSKQQGSNIGKVDLDLKNDAF